MEGAQEVPAVVTNAKGIASLVLNKTRDTIFMNISANGLSGAIASAHIHTGVAGANGGVLIDLYFIFNFIRIKNLLVVLYR
jgi:CHRD domain